MHSTKGRARNLQFVLSPLTHQNMQRCGAGRKSAVFFRCSQADESRLSGLRAPRTSWPVAVKTNPSPRNRSCGFVGK
jgi:hypothetical protein